MKNKIFKGKAIYNPSGKAAEYSEWACNFYVGCSNGCTYCYLKKGRGANVLGGDEPKLKACFKNEDHAFEVFKKEVLENIDELREKGLFFSFTTDPMIKETHRLTIKAVHYCNLNNVPVKILTKEIENLYLLVFDDEEAKEFSVKRELISIGVTLTGHDELEPNASSNNDRILALKLLKQNRFKTFVSIEPIIDFESSRLMILETLEYCDLYKIGLESGKKYNRFEALEFVLWLDSNIRNKIYLKESLKNLPGINKLILGDNFVDRDYNMFK